MKTYLFGLYLLLFKAFLEVLSMHFFSINEVLDINYNQYVYLIWFPLFIAAFWYGYKEGSILIPLSYFIISFCLSLVVYKIYQDPNYTIEELKVGFLVIFMADFVSALAGSVIGVGLKR